MKVALFTDNFLPGTGGTENVVARLGTELSKNHQVIVFAPSYHKEFDDGVFPFKVVRAKSIQITDNDFWAMPKISPEVKKAIEEFKPDVVHSHTMGMMADFANTYAKKHGIPSISTAHTKYRYCYNSAIGIPFIVNLIIKRIIKRVNKADRATAVSQSMMQELYSYGCKKQVTIVRNGHDIKGFVPSPKVKDGVFKILYVGLVIDFKNIKFSLDALKELNKKHQNFTFSLIGRGPHIKRFAKYAKKIGLKDKVEFLGVIKDRQVLYNHYSQADLMLFTSIFDTDGLVLLEAAEAGTPSLVLKDTGASERYTDGVTGFIVENDKNKVAQKIASLIEDEALLKKVGEKALNVFLSWSEIVKDYEKIYIEEIEKKKAKKI